MKDTLIYIAVIVALTAVCVLSIKSCRDNKREPLEKTFTQRQIDSVAAVYSESERLLSELILKNNVQSSVNDSLKMVAAKTADSLELQSLRSRLLSREVQLARQKIKDLEGGADLSNYMEKCDSLAVEADRLALLADKSRIENRVLQNSYDSLLGTNSIRIARVEFERDFYKEKFDTVAAYSLALEKAKTVSDKKAKKRLGIGPSIGGTYYQEKIRPFAGISLQYHLIRF